MRLALGIAVLVALTGCGVSDERALRGEIRRVVPPDAEQRGTCDFASGWAENARPSLHCRFLVRGSAPRATATLRERLGTHGFRVRVAPVAGPGSTVLEARSRGYSGQVVVIDAGRFLFWELRQTLVPAGKTGVSVWLQRAARS